MKTKIYYASCFALLFVLLLGGCRYSESQTHEDTLSDPIFIGSIQALTGGTQVYGNLVREGIDLAVSDINNHDGINGRPLAVLHEDSRSKQIGAVNAAHKLTTIDHVPLILGPTSSSNAMSIAPLLEDSKTVMIASAPSVLDLKYAGDYVFRVRESTDPHSIQLAHYAYNEGYRRAAIFHIHLDNGIAYKDAFVTTFEKLGGEIVAIETLEKEDTSFLAQLTKIKSKKPDVLFLATHRSQGQILKQIYELGLGVPVIGPVTIENPELIEIAGSAAEGVVYSNTYFDPQSNFEPQKSFNAKYIAVYGKEPSSFSANAYDATMLAADALRECGEDSFCIKEYLYTVRDYPGVGGTFSFDSYGEVEKELTMKTIRNGEFVFLE